MKERVFQILGIAVGLTMALYVAQAAVGAALLALRLKLSEPVSHALFFGR